MHTVDRVLDYIVNTPELGLVLGGHGGVKLSATADASYGTHEDRKSHSGCTLHIGDGSGAFLSRSKKETVTADSYDGRRIHCYAFGRQGDHVGSDAIR